MSDENKQILQSFVTDVLDGKNLQAADRYLIPNFLHHDQAPGLETENRTGREGIKRFFAKVVFPGFSDFRSRFDVIIAEKDLVAARWTQSVRHTGEWLGVPPTGKQATIDGISIVRIRDGMIVEEWESRDTIRLLHEFNVIPLPQPLEDADNLGPPLSPPGGRPIRVIGTVIGGGLAPLVRIDDPVVLPIPELETNKNIVGQYMHDALNRGELTIIDQLFASNFANNNPLAGQRLGRDGIKQFIDRVHAAFPDANFLTDLTLGEGDKVAARWTMRGTHKGRFLGLPPTERQVTLSGINFYRIERQQIQETWGHWPQAEMLRAVGGLG